MIKTIIDKLPSFISDNVALAQIIVVFLFFECFSIITMERSLINTPIKLDSVINLKPFFLFLIFIAFSKVVWGFIYYLLYLIIPKSKITLSGKGSFTTFLLFEVGVFYSFFLIREPMLSPFYGNWIINKLFITLLSISVFLIGIIIVTSEIKDER